MLETLTSHKFNLSRFDWIIIATLAGLALSTGFLAWRGDQVGVQIVKVSPPYGSTNVSTKINIRVDFDQVIAASDIEPALTLSPPVSGTIRWQEAALIFSPAKPLAPNTVYSVKLAENLRSQRGRPLLSWPAWQFQTRQTRLLYVAPDSVGIDQLFSIDLATPEDVVQLTQESFGVVDYVLSTDGTRIIYSALRQDRGSDMWMMASEGGVRQPLLPCPEAACSGAAWAPDERRLVYERRNKPVSGETPELPQLWWLDIASGETVPVFEANQTIGYGPGWSADGRWLSYVVPSRQGVQVYNVNNGRNLFVPSRTGSAGVWSPADNILLVSDMVGPAVHLLRATPERGELADVSGAGNPVEDGSPAWSPDGQWIALTRRPTGPAQIDGQLVALSGRDRAVSGGKQIWLMHSDGSEARALTDDPNVQHDAPVWSLDGRLLAFQRLLLEELKRQPGIWLMDIETGRVWELVTPGKRPTWLP